MLKDIAGLASNLGIREMHYLVPSIVSDMPFPLKLCYTTALLHLPIEAGDHNPSFRNRTMGGKITE